MNPERANFWWSGEVKGRSLEVPGDALKVEQPEIRQLLIKCDWCSTNSDDNEMFQTRLESAELRNM